MASAMPSESATHAALAAEGRTLNPSRTVEELIGVSLKKFETPVPSQRLGAATEEDELMDATILN
jgi:hypothetical protein